MTDGLLNGITICPMDGETERYNPSVLTLQHKEEKKELLDPNKGEEKQVSPEDIKSGIGDFEEEEVWLEQIARKLKLDIKKGKDVSTHKLTEAGEEDIKLGIKYLDKAKDLQEEERSLDEMVLRLGSIKISWALTITTV